MSTHSLYSEPKLPSKGGPWVIYDLRHPAGRELARGAQAAWGKYRSDIYAWGADHVILNLRPGGAQGVMR
jgi:hypothetical protein